MASIKLFYTYTIAYLFKLFLIPFLILTSKKASKLTLTDLHNNLVTLTFLSSLTVFTSILYFLTRQKPVYLVDFSCYLPPPHLKVNISKTIEIFDQIRKANPNWNNISNQTNLDFLKKIQERSGLGDETYSSEGLLHIPPRQNLAAVREETEEVIIKTLENLFENTNISPREIGILVVNCSIFNPTPSLSAMVVNKFKLRSNVKSFNLGGMGCSAGIIAIDLAKDLLQVHKNTYALVISTENVTKSVYSGDNKSMMVSNCLFRLGGAAVLLSNNVRDRKRSKYRLCYTLRTHTGADDKCFQCVQEKDDENGVRGVCLTKDVTFVAGKTVKANIRALAPLILPLSEKILFFVSAIGAKVFKEKIRVYVPDFKLAIDHFCIHAGGRGVIDVLEKNLGLLERDVEASRSTLHRFGNTSSSSVWYELAYVEAKGTMKKGHKVWQIGLGSGFKCNSAVWVALCDVKASRNSPWEDCIDRYPIDMSLVNGRS